MATPPNKEYNWAVDSVFDTNFGPSGSAWHGEPNKVLPVTTRISQGYVPSQSLDAESLNYYLNSHGDWIDWLSSSLDPLIQERTRELQISVGAGMALSGWSNTFGRLEAYGDRVYWQLDVNQLFPSGAVITEATALVNPGAAEPTEIDRMRLGLFQVAANFTSGSASWSGNSAIDNVYADSTANLQVLQLTNSFAVDKETPTFYMIRSSINAPTSADNFYGMKFVFTTPRVTDY